MTHRAPKEHRCPRSREQHHDDYERQGTGEPLMLIPYLAADHACYAFQVPAYSRLFTCFSIDLRGTGETENPSGGYTTETLADDVAGFMQAVGIPKAHVAGLSLGGGDRHVAGGEVPGHGSDVVTARRLGEDRCLPTGRRRKLADDGEGGWA